MLAESEPLMLLEDVAEHFRVCKATVKNWIREGRLPRPFRVGRKVYLTMEQINRHLARRTHKA
jgi:predicted site-specific integrase-resolvase